MRLYVGITDRDWYRRLSTARPDEVNFWKPGAGGSFGSLSPGELFLFKLHAPDDFIVGGGHFVRFSRLPMSLAWLAFGEKNGVSSPAEFLARIRKYRKVEPGPDPDIGNVVLTQPFWFERSAWIRAPSDWPKSTVQGKGYDALDSRGYDLWAQVRERLGQPIGAAAIQETVARYSRAEVDVRLGQGAFRIVVLDAYDRHCAVTGEGTLPVLEAAHIRPFSADGPHEVQNGLLLRSDMHTLFDSGLITVTPELRMEVSPQIREQFTNGKLYYSYHGSKLKALPQNRTDHPSREFLAWHNDHVYRP
ncbi:MAG: HNH endonuclease [Fimbriimonadaceae bacterium]